MYWFAHKTYSAVIRAWIRLCIKWVENWWLNGSEIRLVAISYMFPPFPDRFPMFRQLFPQFLSSDSYVESIQNIQKQIDYEKLLKRNE